MNCMFLFLFKFNVFFFFLLTPRSTSIKVSDGFIEKTPKAPFGPTPIIKGIEPYKPIGLFKSNLNTSKLYKRYGSVKKVPSLIVSGKLRSIALSGIP